MNKEEKYELSIESIPKACIVYKEKYFDKATNIPINKYDYVSTTLNYNTYSCKNSNDKYINLISKNLHVLQDVLVKSKNIENKELKKNVFDFIFCFISLLNKKEDISNNLTPLNIAIEDDSVFLEWAFRDFRIGFTIMENEKDSMWFLISNKNLREKTYSEMLQRSDYQQVIANVLKYVLENT